MRLSVTYDSDSGDISTVCALPADSGMSAGGSLQAGESFAVIDIPDGKTLSYDSPEIHAELTRIGSTCRVHTGKAELVEGK